MSSKCCVSVVEECYIYICSQSCVRCSEVLIVFEDILEKLIFPFQFKPQMAENFGTVCPRWRKILVFCAPDGVNFGIVCPRWRKILVLCAPDGVNFGLCAPDGVNFGLCAPDGGKFWYCVPQMA